MQCRVELTKTQIEHLLGKIFIKTVLHKNIIGELIIVEKALISQTASLVQYFTEIEEYKRNILQGRSRTLARPVRPEIADSSSKELCTVHQCRGYLLPKSEQFLECMACKHHHCAKCVVVVANPDEPHVCDPIVLQNMDDIRASTKQCPRCITRIFKTEGCDHMHCSNCNTHFSWLRGVVITGSSNHHYRDHLIIHNSSSSSTAASAEQQRGEENGSLLPFLSEDRIPRDGHPQPLPSTLVRYLYTDTEYVRLYYSNHLRELEREYGHHRANIRVMYIRHQLSEVEWGKQLFRLYKWYTQRSRQRKILHEYMMGMNDLQARLFYEYPLTYSESQCIADITEMLHRCNQSFLQINTDNYLEDPKQVFHFKVPSDPPTMPAFGLQYLKTTQQLADFQAWSITSKTKAPTTEVKPITLFPYQQAHFDRLTEIVDQYGFGLDLSPLGTGKTYIMCHYLQQHQPTFARALILCPSSLKAKWMQVAKEYGIVLYVLTYTELIGTRHQQPKHGLLHRTESVRMDDHGQPVESVEYSASAMLLEWCAEGLFLGADEIQALKNARSCSTLAAEVLCSTVRTTFLNGGNTRCLLASGTPVDKREQSVTFFKTMGIMTEPLTHWNIGTRTMTNEGFGQIRAFCDTLPSTPWYTKWNRNTRRVSGAYDANRNTFQLFVHMVIPTLSSSMPIPPREKSLFVYNTLYEINHANDDALNKDALQRIEHIMNTEPANRMLMMHAYQMLELSKARTMAEDALRILRDQPTSKVVVGVNFRDSMEIIADCLAAYSPLLLNGDTSPTKRYEWISLFQEPNLNRRVIVGNIQVMCSGIDLDDKHGGFPRVVLVNPNFSSINMYQFVNRFIRSTDSKSHAVVRCMFSRRSMRSSEYDLAQRGQLYSYPKTDKQYVNLRWTRRRVQTRRSDSDNMEIRMLHLLNAKGDVMKEVNRQVVSHSTYPFQVCLPMTRGEPHEAQLMQVLQQLVEIEDHPTTSSTWETRDRTNTIAYGGKVMTFLLDMLEMGEPPHEQEEEDEVVVMEEEEEDGEWEEAYMPPMVVAPPTREEDQDEDDDETIMLTDYMA
jgi:hypothetical protein